MKVVEIASFIAGPYAGQLLADLGADVVKVEPPGKGDPFRAFAGQNYSPNFVGYNRNKRSIEADIRSEAGQEIVRGLVQRSDVLVENFRPGVMRRFGLDYPAMRRLRPQIIYCSVSGFGQDGPSAGRPVYDTVGQALGGLLSQLIDPEHPRIIGPAFTDGLAGLTAAYGILAAIHARDLSGVGQHVDVSMFASTIAFLSSEVARYYRTGELGGPRSRPSISQSYAFTCRDGRVITVHLSSPLKFWQAFVAAIDRPDLLDDPRFDTREGRIHNFEELHELLAPLFRTRDLDDWRRSFSAFDVPHAQVNTIQDVFLEPQARHLGLELRMKHPSEGEVVTVAPPVIFSDTPVANLSPPPSLGEHTREVLGELGFTLADPHESQKEGN
ncbi:MAG: CoA transferase [Actinomycetota bacterium]|nr:MAG: CoA transferase [Actinomycetota bacterium]